MGNGLAGNKDPYTGSAPVFIDSAHFRFWGNYAGPGWSAGKYDATPLEALNGNALDDLDEACKIHDLFYYIGEIDEGDKQLHNLVKDKYSQSTAFAIDLRFAQQPVWTAILGLNKEQACALLDQGFVLKVLYEYNVGPVNRPKQVATDEEYKQIKAYIVKQLTGKDMSETITEEPRTEAPTEAPQAAPSDAAASPVPELPPAPPAFIAHYNRPSQIENSVAESRGASMLGTNGELMRFCNPYSLTNCLFPGLESVDWTSTNGSERGLGRMLPAFEKAPGAKTTQMDAHGNGVYGNACDCGCGIPMMQGGNTVRTPFKPPMNWQ